MVWVRIDEEFAKHPKVLKAGPLGMAMQVAGLCYCNSYRTDGFVSRAAAATLLDLSGLAMRMWSGDLMGGGEDADWKLVVEDLEDADLWEPCQGGWMIHDYDEYQPTREQLAKKAEAGQKGGQAGRKQVLEQTGKQTASTSRSKSEAKGQAVPGPVTGTDPLTFNPKGKPSSSSSSTRATRATRSARRDDEGEDSPDGSGQPHVPPSTPSAITVAASLNGTSTRAWLHGTDERGGLTAGEWTKSALRTLTTQAISDELPTDSWPPWAGQVLGEHVAECSRREVTATKVGQLRTLCARHDALSVLEALEVALTDTAVRDHVAYARKCLTAKGTA